MTAAKTSEPFYNADQRRARLIAEATRLGIAVLPVGNIFHLRGQGVDIKTSDLAFVNPAELRL